MGGTAAAALRLGLALTLAAGLPGCAAFDFASLHRGGASSASASPARLERARSKAVEAAEKAVARHRDDSAARAALGQAYLAAGRPASAVGAFGDALALGDVSPASIVGLSLGRIALGDREAAVRLLDEWQATVPAVDRGLALALAGDTARGVDVLAAALRQGEGGSQLRQNLAYAYALDGRWREAAVMAAQDLPPLRAQARIEEWALLARPDALNRRVGYVLGVPLQADPGYPAALALAPAETGARSEELAAAPAP